MYSIESVFPASILSTHVTAFVVYFDQRKGASHAIRLNKIREKAKKRCENVLIYFPFNFKSFSFIQLLNKKKSDLETGLNQSCFNETFILILIFRFDVEQAFLLTTSSVVTASLASFTLGVVMILVVMGKN